MAEAEFGIIDSIRQDKDYSEYEPDKYGCIGIDDDRYMDDWWPQLCLLKTYFHRLDRPAFGLARYGVTLIPPASLAQFQDIVLSDKRMKEDIQLVLLSELIGRAIRENKYMIHYGV